MFKNQRKILRILFTALLIAIVFWTWAYAQVPDRKFHICFLNVGQGDSIFVKTPQNHQILIDGGPKNKVIQELNHILPFFDKSIDLVVLTHPHADHVEGLVEVVKRYQVENVLITGVNYPNAAYNEFLKQVNSQGIPVYIADQITDFKFGEVQFDVIFPFENLSGQTIKNLNNSSIALLIRHNHYKVLLTGDLESEIEHQLIQSDLNLNVDIVKAGHHGSKTASNIDFLKRIAPQTVVIQSGIDNKFNHPHPETLRNLYRAGVFDIRRNDQDGRIEFIF